MNIQDPLAHLCPVCGQTNHCSMAEDSLESNDQKQSSVSKKGIGTKTQCTANEKCWCMSEPINHVKNKLPSGLSKMKRCLCKKCLHQQQTQQ